jgi:flagellar motor switch protein FliN/FliY
MGVAMPKNAEIKLETQPDMDLDDPSSAAPRTVEARIPDFGELVPQANAGTNGSLDNLLDVNCTVTAELGRLQLAIGEVLKLHLGSVLELDRLITDPVDIVVQGVRLARGEVVVVNDHFAIRIKEIIDPKKRG